MSEHLRLVYNINFAVYRSGVYPLEPLSCTPWLDIKECSIPHLPRVQLSLAGGTALGDGDSQSPTGGEGPGVFIYLH